MDAVNIQNLNYAYPNNNGHVPLYKGFCLSIEQGKVTAVMGASGCGKSTLGKLVGEVLEPQAGTIEWSDAFKEKRHRFYVDQDPKRVLFAQQTARENLEYIFKKDGLKKSQYGARVLELLKQFGLSDQAEVFPKELSGGEKSRLALARVLAWEPNAIILDECLSGLDVNNQSIMLKILQERASRGNSTTIFITHTVREVLQIADRCVILGAAPVYIMHDIPISLPFPRHESTPEYNAAQDHLISLLRDQL